MFRMTETKRRNCSLCGKPELLSQDDCTRLEFCQHVRMYYGEDLCANCIDDQYSDREMSFGFDDETTESEGYGDGY